MSESLGSSVLDLSADDSDLEEALEGAKEKSENAADDIEASFQKVGLALGAAGVAAEGFARSQADTTATFRRVAIATGMSESALRADADAMSDHTFASADAAAGMEFLVRKGFDTREEFNRILPAVDNLADATGKDFVEAIEAADKLLAPFGNDLNDVGDNSDQMARLITQTDVPLSTLERNLGRVPDELQELGFGLDDAAAGIEVFRDRGFTGQEAVREFRRAVADSEGDMDTLLDNLGIGADEWDDYLAAVEPAPGLTDELADANNSVMTPMQRMQANVANLMTRFGGLGDILGQAAPAMTSVGMAMVAGGPAIRGASGAFSALRGIMLGHPLFLLAAAIIGIGAAVWIFRDEIAGALRAAWDFISGIFGRIRDFVEDALGDLVGFLVRWHPIAVLLRLTREHVPRLLGLLRDLPARAVRAIGNLGRTLWNGLRGGITWLLGRVRGAVGDIVGVWTGLPGQAARALGNLGRDLWNAARMQMASLINNFKNRVDAIVGFFRDIPGRAARAIRGLGDAAINALKAGWNVLARAWNRLVGGRGFSIPNIPGVPGRGSRVEVPTLPELADGGIVVRDTLASLHATEAVIPLDRLNDFGFGDDGVVAELRALRRDLDELRPVRVDAAALSDREAARIMSRAGAALARSMG